MKIVKFNDKYGIERDGFFSKTYLDMQDFPGQRNWRKRSSQYFSVCWTSDVERAQEIFKLLVGDIVEYRPNALEEVMKK